MVETLVEHLREGWDVHSCIFHGKTSNNEEGMIMLTSGPALLLELRRQYTEIYSPHIKKHQISIYCVNILKKWNDLCDTHAYRTKRLVPKFLVRICVPLYP